VRNVEDGFVKLKNLHIEKDERCKVVPVLNYLSTTKLKRIGE
jgi:hypothetical protein